MRRADFRFVVVDHPEQLRNKQAMRENRIHVMHDYLGKQGHRSDATCRPKKQKRSPLATTNGSRSSDTVSPCSKETSSISSERSPIDANLDNEHIDSQARAQKALTSSQKQPDRRKAIKQIYQPPSDGQHLVNGIGGRFEHSAYMRTTWDDVPAGPGAKLEPFGTWPTLIDPELDVNSLKWSCSQRFGSNSLATHWIPALMRARHAFLSTCCISSAHDTIMARALGPSKILSDYKNTQRLKIKHDVFSLVKVCMDDPVWQAADETIITVLHLLNSNIMGGDDREMRVHQDGLIEMVRQRGGLEQLGVGGQLAGVLTITNYLIATLRETTPHSDYLRYASKQDTRFPNSMQPLPESPLYSRPPGFHNLQRHLAPSSETFVLLDIVRILTNRFIVENAGRAFPSRAQCQAARLGAYSSESMDSLCKMVFDFIPASDKEFNDMNERYTYESVRLAARIYAYALSHQLPFSKAAARLSLQEESPKSLKNRGREQPIAIQLKHALMRTDISFCWDHLGGVLFWIAMVGGAAANPGPYAEEERVGEAEEARKFLAAIAVRCAIVLSFQYGYAILGTLKRIVTIEAALAEQDLDPADSPMQPRTTKVFGPVEPSHLQSSFADFAFEFRNM